MLYFKPCYITTLELLTINLLHWIDFHLFPLENTWSVHELMGHRLVSLRGQWTTTTAKPPSKSHALLTLLSPPGALHLLPYLLESHKSTHVWRLWLDQDAMTLENIHPNTRFLKWIKNRYNTIRHEDPVEGLAWPILSQLCSSRSLREFWADQ